MKKFFFSVPNEDNRVLEARKTIFLNRYGMSLFKILFLGELLVCKISYPQEVWNIEIKKYFP
jgi:hypothetical protein